MVSEDSSSHSNTNILHEFVTSNHIPQTQFENHHFHAYSEAQIPLSIRCLAETQLSDESDMGLGPGPGRHLIDLLGPANEAAAAAAQQLSLSLSSGPCRNRTLNSVVLNPNDYGSDGSGFSPYSSYGVESFASAIGGSKYLQPAQSLLEEMLSVGENIADREFMEKLSRNCRNGSFSLSSKLKSELSHIEFIIEKHDDYVNLIKLIALLAEVERRYEEYSHHMEELVTSFEAIAGIGAAKSYTTLAILAMSKHFCRLRKTILSRIHVMKKKILKDVSKISSGLSQLSLFDQEARHNRMMIQNSVQTWRPLRGLPETSVTILRAWLFEHFLHPYPNDSEKLMLASQTGLSKNQVSNWFINARVRLWKPMIEEMYKEEFEDHSSTESDQLLTNSINDLGD